MDQPNIIKMKSFFKLLFCASVCLMAIEACQQTEKPEEKEQTILKKKTHNPNGDSELALLMRDMFDEAERIKKNIKNGQEFEVKLDHEKILTAHATEPEKANSQQFKDFAKMYLANLEQLKKSNEENVEMVFQSLVSSCLSCHQQLCPGPMVRIKKLKMPKQKEG